MAYFPSFSSQPIPERPVQFRMPTSRLRRPGVFSNGEHIWMQGSLIRCLQVINERQIGPEEVQTRFCDMEAVL